ncbi:hypothetical protein [Phaffia rhodozyma]|uniref:Uncharacterized protein n=1 Tax=Phaffia rhodozyma TaxID=264483 RepID=A0A0F7SSF0_PHARH|nr:hypothetical protein [Phaffia rhodozyma]
MPSQTLPSLALNSSGHLALTGDTSPTDLSLSSPPSPNVYQPRIRSPLTTPAVTDGSFGFPSASSKPSVQMIERRPSPPSFPRSRPLRPAVVRLTNIDDPVKKAIVPLNQKSRIGGNGLGLSTGTGPRKAKILTGRSMKNCFELNLSGRELARSD